jgi:hypothetical protein
LTFGRDDETMMNHSSGEGLEHTPKDNKLTEDETPDCMARMDCCEKCPFIYSLERSESPSSAECKLNLIEINHR